MFPTSITIRNSGGLSASSAGTFTTTINDPIFTFPLDSWTGSTAAYSLRKLRSAYAGNAVQLQRADNNATQDIGFLPHGNLDTASANTFISGTVGRVRKWYDQSGNSNDLIQTDQTKQFIYQAAGSEVWPGTLSPRPVLIGNSIPYYSGWISGTTLNVTTIGAGVITYIAAAGKILVGDPVVGISPTTVSAGTIITAQLTGTPGGAGTYSVNNSQTVGSSGSLQGFTTSGKSMQAADSSTYKTSGLHAFMVAKLGWGIANGASAHSYGFIAGYPDTGSTETSPHPWAIAWGANNSGYETNYGFISNGFANGSPGFAKTYTDYLNQWDWSISGTSQLVTVNDIPFDGTGQSAPQSGNREVPNAWGGVSLSYPRATGLCIGGGADNTCNSTCIFGELILYSSTQASRSSIASNQKSYWGMVVPPRSIVSSDGFTWLPNYVSIREFGNTTHPNFPYQTLTPIPTTGGNRLYYVQESNMWPWSLWRADPSKLATGQDLWRMEIRSYDGKDVGSTDANRSELDPNFGDSPQPNPGFFSPYGKISQQSFAFYIEPGTAFTQTQWMSIHQNHFTDGSFPPNSWSLDLFNGDFVQLSSDSSSFSAPNYRMGVSVTRGTWYRYFLESFVDTNRSVPQDTVSLWLQGPGIAGGTTFTNVYTAGPANLHATATGTSGQGTYAKFGVYQGTALPIPNFAIRYANMETSYDKTVLDISGRITSPLALPTHT